MLEERENQEILKEQDSGYKQGTMQGLSVCLEPPEDGWCWLLVHVTSKMKPEHLFIISVALRGIWRVSSLVLVRFFRGYLDS